MPSTAARAVLLLLVLLVPTNLAAQSTEVEVPGYVGPEAETPDALLSLEVGDAEVELFVEGSWRVGLDAGVGLRWVGDGPAELTAGAASLANGLAFHQAPALTLAVRLMDRFYLEAEVRSSVEQESVFLPAAPARKGEGDGDG